jgi:hypothetical protein
MSLKQECIDMIKLIIEPLQDDDMKYYQLETDTYVDICRKTGEDITYSLCSECENYNENCPYSARNIKVDISFYDYATDCMRSYVFGNNAVECEGICTIKNRKQLMTEMFSLKKELETYKDWYAEFGENYKQYLDYAKQFAQEMKEKYLFFGMIQTDILPIIFHTEHCYDNGKTNYSTMGNLYIAEKQNVINVFCCMRNEEETQRTIRHEVLHYMLYIAGLKYADDTAIFHYLCGEYNANAYKEMGDTEQQLYDQLINGVEMLKDACNRNKELDYDLNYICMMLAVCTDEDNSTYDVLCKRGNEILQLFDLKKKAS